MLRYFRLESIKENHGLLVFHIIHNFQILTILMHIFFFKKILQLNYVQFPP